MTTRRDIIKGGAGLAAIIASRKAPAYLIHSMLAARNGIIRGGGEEPPFPDHYWGLCFTAEEDGSTVAMQAVGSATSVSLQYSTNGKDWDDFIVGTTSVTLTNVGDVMYMRAGENGNATMASSASRYNNFLMSGKVAASGNVTSLLNGSTPQTNTLSNYSFTRLFSGCSSLTEPPDIGFTKISHSGTFRGMFHNCVSMRSTPLIPILSVDKGNTFTEMFIGCTSIRKCVMLLEQIPVGPTISISTANSMFYDASSLNDLEIHMASFAYGRRSGFTDWVNGVSPTGTFRCPTALGTNETIQRGTDFCPEGWTVVNID